MSKIHESKYSKELMTILMFKLFLTNQFKEPIKLLKEFEIYLRFDNNKFFNKDEISLRFQEII